MDATASSAASAEDTFEVTQQELESQAPAPAHLSWDELAAGGDNDSWKDLYRLLFTSLRTSSQHFQALSWDTLALGWMGLSSSHAELRDDLEGRTLTAVDRPLVEDLLYHARWAGAFAGEPSDSQLAARLGIEMGNLASYYSESIAAFPASFLVADPVKRSVTLVIRGTTSWPDLIHDIIAHTSPLQGASVVLAHTGMLRCAEGMLTLHMPAIRALLAEHPGYRVHFVGHSMGGGVASLMAQLLRSSNPEYKEHLGGAEAEVFATVYGAPPVVTMENVGLCRRYVRSVVYNDDLVPRTCVHTLALLRAELEGAKEGVYTNNAALGALRNSQVVASASELVGQLFSAASAARVTQAAASLVSRNPATQSAVAAGLVAGASSLSKHLVSLHNNIMQTPPPGTAAGGGAGGAGAGGAAAGAAAAAAAEPEGPASKRPRSAAGWLSGQYLGPFAWPQAGDAAGAGGQAPAPPPAAAAAANGAPAPAGPPRVPAPAPVLRWPDTIPGFGKRVDYTKPPADGVMLYTPGMLYHIKRTGVDRAAAFEMVDANVGQRFERILVRRSMLRDHYMKHYQVALQRVLEAMDAAEAAAPAAEDEAAGVEQAVAA